MNFCKSLFLSVSFMLLGSAALATVPDNPPAPADDKKSLPEFTASQAEVLMVLDKSGSMYSLTEDTIGGFNSMIQKYRDLKLPVKVTTVLFNNRTQVLHNREPIENIKELTKKDYVAEGTTALLDAMGESLTNIDKIPELKNNKDIQVIVVIITDGMENASKEYKKDSIKKMVSDHQEKDGWKFVFLGANIDAVAEAGALGIDTKNAVKYRNSSSGVRSNYEAVVDFTMEAMASDEALGSAAGSWKKKVEKDDDDNSK
ncbi:vWA domain-containing protein [Succinimonas amylolytica]|uniref:vWA domain-containing protein n=1 Tax=Succinimonas amylolytica TaxID=83769 RepID=UPI0023A7C437